MPAREISPAGSLTHRRGPINQVAVHQYRWYPDIVGVRAAGSKVQSMPEANSKRWFTLQDPYCLRIRTGCHHLALTQASTHVDGQLRPTKLAPSQKGVSGIPTPRFP